MVQRAWCKRSSGLWVACVLAAACESTEPAPGVEYDPNLVEDAGQEMPPPPPAGGGGGADAGKDAAAPDAAADASSSGKDASAPDAAPAGEGGSQPEPGLLESAERLLIADGLQQRVYAYDVPARRLLESFTVGAPARVYAGPGGRYGYALPSQGRSVHIFDMGFVQQGAARALEPVAALSLRLTGTAPATLLAQGDWVALFFEGDGRLEVLRESALNAGQGTLESEGFTIGGPQHGFGLPFDGGFLATYLEGGSQLLLGSFDEIGRFESSVSFDCEAPEGAALADGVLAVGCAAGVLRIEPNAAPRVIAYPEGAGAPAGRARRLVGHPSDAKHLTVVGNSLCAMDPSALTCQALAQPALDFGFDASGKRALALGSDGALRAYDADTLQPLGTLRVTSAVITSDPLLQPQLASGRRFTYVSDPQASSVHIVDPASMRLEGRIDLQGAPASLAVFGFR
jgi:hypothetical protein